MTSDAQLRPNRIVTLTTDFGTADAYVGALKGALLRIEPELRLHDLSHEVPPQDVAHGARLLRGACPHFPPGTVHLAVVDPGVGTARAPIVVLAGGHAFVGPDNGLFAAVTAALGGGAARRIEATPALRPLLPATTSATFHGRDLFAPAAAALASGRLRLEEVGPPHAMTAEVARADGPRHEGHVVFGHVTHHDRFGNAITDVTAAHLPSVAGASRSRFRIVLPDGSSLGLSRTYGDAAHGAALALFGSEGFLEIAVRDGSARGVHGLEPGALVRIEPAE